MTSSEIALILQKIDSSDMLKEFLLKVSVSDFEDHVNFEVKGMSVHMKHECDAHNKVFEYGHTMDDYDDDVLWYSGDTEFDHGYFFTQYFDKKYPCCEEADVDCLA